MKKPIVVTVLTGAILALAAPAMGAPPNVSVTGGGTVVDRTGTSNDGTVHITVSARKPAEAFESEGSGNVTIKFPGEPAVHGTVDCLSVEGEESGLTGELDNGLFFNIIVIDGQQTGTSDRADLRQISSQPLFCRTRGANDITNGSF
jgi:hypothetical protein